MADTKFNGTYYNYSFISHPHATGTAPHSFGGSRVQIAPCGTHIHSSACSCLISPKPNDRHKHGMKHGEQAQALHTLDNHGHAVRTHLLCSSL